MGLLEIAAAFLLAIALRVLPHWLAPHGVGVDQWFWKAYIEKFRESGQFPPELPQFLLDERQWYPPVFPLLAACLPAKVFDDKGHYLAVAIDLLRMATLVAVAYQMTLDLSAAALAGFVYALTPILITYNLQVNPRGLGALLLDLIVLMAGGVCWFGMPLWWMAPIGVMAAVLLLTHKMSTQLFWFLALFGGAITLNWHIVAMIPFSLVVALILSKGFYRNVLVAHWDIVSFWNKHWPWLSAHPVGESPIYGKPGFKSEKKYFASGLKGLAHRVSYLGGFNPWAWALLVLVPFVSWIDPGVAESPYQKALWIWLAGVLLFVVLTTFAPFMRALGNGYLYVYNASYPAALLVATLWATQGPAILPSIGFALSLLASVTVCGLFFRTLAHSKTLKADGDLVAAIEHLRQLPSFGSVMCFPQHWHDLVAYKSGKAVLFGGHGYGFRRLEPIFPRVMEPIKEVIARYRVAYLLTYSDYLPENFLADLPSARIESFGQYRLYSFQ